mmetsp:Transcript_20547/g.51869  ORF Transcript_20547/g.51869 Transcript_20547/m.51869 type:complete len:334 (-) Transcript_20547:420-1421(-)
MMFIRSSITRKPFPAMSNSSNKVRRYACCRHARFFSRSRWLALWKNSFHSDSSMVPLPSLSICWKRKETSRDVMYTSRNSKISSTVASDKQGGRSGSLSAMSLGRCSFLEANSRKTLVMISSDGGASFSCSWNIFLMWLRSTRFCMKDTNASTLIKICLRSSSSFLDFRFITILPSSRIFAPPLRSAWTLFVSITRMMSTSRSALSRNPRCAIFSSSSKGNLCISPWSGFSHCVSRSRYWISALADRKTSAGSGRPHEPSLPFGCKTSLRRLSIFPMSRFVRPKSSSWLMISSSSMSASRAFSAAAASLSASFFLLAFRESAWPGNCLLPRLL